jgi:RNA polymerase sigma-70 factor (ECF subfamily)
MPKKREPLLLETTQGEPILLPAPGDRLRVWILDVDGTRLVVWAGEAAGFSSPEHMQSLIDTIQIGAPWLVLTGRLMRGGGLTNQPRRVRRAENRLIGAVGHSYRAGEPHVRGSQRGRDVERQLVIQAQEGDRDAFNLLVTNVVDRLYSVAYRILRNGPSAEDATQQALVDIWRHLPGLRDPDRFDAWAYRLLVNAAYGEHRRRRRAAPPGALSDGETDRDPYPSIHDRDQLERGFARLSAEHRAVLVLQHYLDMTHDEMADVLGIPVGTVRSRLHGARGAMRAALEADARPAAKEWPV